MEIAFTVKNMSRAMKPNTDDVLLFNGKIWYVTTKQELFKEYEEELAKIKKEKEDLVAELKAFQVDISKQMLEYGKLIREVISKGEK